MKNALPQKQNMWHRFLMLPISLLFMEAVLCLATGSFGARFIAVAMYSLVLGGFLNVLSLMWSEKTNFRVLLGVQIALSVWYITQIVYHSFFGKFMILYSVFAGGADQVIASGLVENTLGAIAGCWWTFPVYLLPIVGILLYCRRFALSKLRPARGLLGLAVSVLFYLSFIGAGYFVPYLKEVQTDVFNKELSVKSFGLLRSELLDIRCSVLGLGGKGEIEVMAPAEPSVPPAPTYKTQTENIDFSALAERETDKTLKTLHTYFAAETPSFTNEYTGMFEGYNLIQITAEGFSPYAIHPELTPTLYKMQQEGFHFTNFYTPLWEVSTSDGEFAATTGLIPKSGVWSYHMTGESKTLLPYTMPQQYLASGVERVRAYHNHNYAYYHRDISHTNLGFIYKGVGNGLTLTHDKIWPESDLEMMESTTKEFLDGSTPFMTYYMTVSGHMEYTFDGNSIAAKNKELVAHLPFSEQVRAYYACNIEFDRAMEKLLSDLEAAGVADKTLIAITPDHYPYGLEDKNEENPYRYIEELTGEEIDPTFALYKSCLILYSPSMKEPVTVDKYCSSLDIIPTLNNLLGFSYDSRLLMGRDILSDSAPLVIFLDRSFICEKGKYNAETDTFTPFDGQTASKAYIEEMKTRVRNKFKVSAAMLETDYYSLVTDREHLYSK